MDVKPAVFFSYARADDERERGKLSALRQALEAELAALSGDTWEVFQDVEDVRIGQQWRRRLSEGLTDSTFFVPVLTPTYLKRPFCRQEVSEFLEKERTLNRDDLLLPVLFLETPALHHAPPNPDVLAQALAARQWDDWRDLRVHGLGTAKVRQRISGLASAILAARCRRGVTGQISSKPSTPESRHEIAAPTEQPRPKASSRVIESQSAKSSEAIEHASEPRHRWWIRFVAVPLSISDPRGLDVVRSAFDSAPRRF